jgi:FdhE protein
MVSIEEIIEKKPHLKDTLRLYENVVEFNRIVKDLILSEETAYSSELIEPIFKTFSSIFEIPEEDIEPLKEAMRLGQIDLARLPLNEVPPVSLPYNKDEIAKILFLISKPYFIRLRNSCNLDNIFWQEGRCPVCHSIPSIAAIDKDGKKHLYCSFCGTTGYYKRIGCPSCLNSDTSKINIITAEEEEGIRIDICDVCSSYLKTIEIGLLEDLTPELADLISLPLDIIAQVRGYTRPSSNPIGMIKMSFT